MMVPGLNMVVKITHLMKRQSNLFIDNNDLFFHNKQ